MSNNKIDKVETRGRKKMNDDGSARTGRYVRCLHCQESFYYDYKNPDCRPVKIKLKSTKKETMQDKIDKLITQLGDEDASSSSSAKSTLSPGFNKEKTIVPEGYG